MMLFKRKERVVQKSVGAMMMLEGAKAVPARALCDALYTVILMNPGIAPKELNDLSNRIGRLAWERDRK